MPGSYSYKNLVAKPAIEWTTSSSMARSQGFVSPETVAVDRLLARVSTATEVRTDSGLTLLGVGGGRRPDPLLVKLRTVLDENDARHVFQAIKNAADVFLTADGASSTAEWNW